MLIRKAKERASGVTAKGIECLELSVAGYKSREIGEMMNADASAVRMWMTKARRFLMVQPEIMDACEEVT
jgi:DNA-directed RNA polymerase specialized sigma24 family protein